MLAIKQTKTTLVNIAPDIAFFALLILFWIVYVGPIVINEQRHGYDIFRDAGSAINIQNGQLFADPAYRGESLWYPPLSPMIAAGVSELFGITPLDCYRLSQLALNWMIPAGLFLVMRLQWGRRAAILGTAALLFAMPWWQTEVHQGQPSIHAVILGWAAVALYAQQHKRQSNLWALACGVFQGICFWHHPFIPALLAAGFVLQTSWECARAGKGAWFSGAVGRTLLITSLTFLTAGPILYQMLHGPVLNRAGREYLAGELQTVQFALLYGSPWLWATGLVGLVYCARRADFGGRLLVSVLAVTILGQMPGYLRLYGGDWARGIPIFVPHEFQRFFQLGWAIVIGIGTDAMLLAIAGRVKFLRANTFLAGLLTLAACVITGGQGLAEAKINYRQYLHPFPKRPLLRQADQWIFENTNINDVFACEPELAFRWLNAETGRKVWIMPEGHSNPRVDWKQRARVLDELENATSAETFWQLAHQYEINYFVPTAKWLPKIIADENIYREAVPTYIELVYGSHGSMSIYKIAVK